ncbi:MAG: hypothetical protein LBS54_06270 [Dysgonamonadaceae bacterium]|jgi:hypothetical protein|nr:hypothetical protein [Dysgonamonadaceae bacterium]
MVYKFLTVLPAMLFFIMPASMAQNPKINASIDSMHIFIGNQTLMHVEIAAGKEMPVTLPAISDTIVTGVEVLDMSAIDTVDIGNDRMMLKYDYRITSFDSAVYLLPSLMVIQGPDTAYSEELALKVSTLPVDTESKQFYDIKDIVKPKFVLWDYIMMPLLIWFAVLIVAFIGLLVYRIIKKKPLPFLTKEEPILPPHVKAFGKLDEIRSQKLWQQGKMKLYHSEITDTLRKYIEERFNIGAMEMTSGEILNGMSDVDEAKMSIDKLKPILSIADFVKFAKYSPLPEENEMSLNNAYLFVEDTKIVETEIQGKTD